MNENLIINRVSILRKGQEPKTYLLPSFEDIIKANSIKLTHLNWAEIKDALDAIYEKKSDHTSDFNSLSNTIPVLNLDNNNDLVYRSQTFLNKNNLENYLPTNLSELQEQLQALSAQAEELEEALASIDLSRYALAVHTHTFNSLTDVTESNGYIQIGDKYIEELNSPLITLSAQASSGGKVYITPQVKVGQKAILVAEPDAGYKFLRWNVNGSEISTNPIHIIESPVTSTYFGIFIEDSPEVVEPTYYTLQFSSSNNQYGVVRAFVNGNEVISGVSLEENTLVTLIAEAASRYMFDSWSGITATTAETSFRINSDCIVQANFKLDPTQAVFTYKAQARPAESVLIDHVSTTQNLNTELTVQIYQAFTLQVPSNDIAPTVNSCGYSFLHWTGDYQNTQSTSRTWTGTASDNMLDSYPKLNPSGLTNFFANYKKTFMIKVGSAKCGSQTLGPSPIITINGASQPTTVTVDENTVVRITAPIIPGYTFSKWNDNNTTNPREITVTNSAEIYPIFTENAPSTYTITGNVASSGGGTVNGGGSYAVGSSVTLTAIPAEGYHFVSWNDGDTNAAKSIVVSGDATYTATFALNTYTITTNVTPTNSGTVTASGTAVWDTDYTLTATPASHYHFVEWKENNQKVSEENPYEFTVSANRNITAVFAKDQVTINASAGTGGTLNNTPTTQTVDYETSVTVKAIASTGYDFTSWTENGAQVSTNTSYTFTATSTRTLLATFTKKSYSVSVSVTPTGGGTATVNNASSTTIEHGNTATLSATANSNYAFVKWTLNGTQVSTNASYQPTITAAASYVAHFEAIPQVDETIYYFASTNDDYSPVGKTVNTLEIDSNTNKLTTQQLTGVDTLVFLAPSSVSISSIKDIIAGTEIISRFLTHSTTYNTQEYTAYYYTDPNVEINGKFIVQIVNN